ncbi:MULTISPECIES: class I SAM-dependent methyltransferase [Acidobacteriaceae]|uniref:class I SAM-dependent methyltransferase n=1 Tax=Acidobacteriaceae TaxID=204434 RepID=UPI00131B07CD|nr:MULTISPECIES: class I SAM-dependent methyltransferase [Acidobacteriaceae]MDW5267535.1 class I SAM-dependent methyltransferase [Edaphobacter sp.]
MSKNRLNAYLKHGQFQVKGWLLPGAAEAVVLLSEEQRSANVRGAVAEIGVHHGRLFILLYLLGAVDEPAVAIDLFSHQDLNVDHSGAGDLECFKQNLRKHADADRLIVHEGDSTQLTSGDLLQFGRGPLRMISIDGGHTADITAHDLAVGEGALAEGGIIILDDCFNETWPGVIDGVHRHFSQARAIVPFGIGANKTFFCHPSFARKYADVLRKMDRRSVEQEFLGQPVVCFHFVHRSFSQWYRRVDPWRSLRRTYHDALSRLSR